MNKKKIKDYRKEYYKRYYIEKKLAKRHIRSSTLITSCFIK